MLPLGPILGGLAGLIGTGATAYQLGTAIKDRNARKRAERQAASDRANAAKQAAIQAKKNKQVPGKPNQPVNPTGVNPTVVNPQNAPIGNVSGQVQPGIGSTLKDKLLGTSNRVEQFQNLTPEQQAAQSSVLQQALSRLGSNEFDFAPIEQLSRENFERRTVPSLLERYSGGALNRALASAGTNLDTQLAALRSQHALGQQGLNQQLLGLGLRPQFENAFFPGAPGFLDTFGQNLAGTALTPENAANLFRYLQSLGLGKNQIQQPEEQIPGQEAQIGDFSQNQALQNFINQANNPTPPPLSQQLQQGTALTQPENLVPGVQNQGDWIQGMLDKAAKKQNPNLYFPNIK